MQLKDEPDGDEPELITPEDFLPPSPFPVDAQRMGIDRYTGGEAGFLAVVSALDGSKLTHRLFAYFLLVTVVGCFCWTLFGQLNH
ncbi:hypothetical protein ABIE44_001137 [Marmoricola sp. OAE513]|uniref:hypothetical protein n=1 Tax=Marmoricola sp. OAE513 TaxID=2817894 RepID=UPI001AE25ADE